MLVPRFWRFANAFLGSERFAQVIGQHPNVRLAICGHIHEARNATIGAQRFCSIGSDYARKALLMIDGEHTTRRYF